MTIYIGADHRGFQLKEDIKHFLNGKGHSVVDCGATSLSPEDDYVDFAKKVAESLRDDHNSRGILLCGSGIGMSITANKFPGIRCGLVTTVESVVSGRQDDDINVISLPSDVLDTAASFSIIESFLSTAFKGEERFIRRLNKLKEIEHHA